MVVRFCDRHELVDKYFQCNNNKMEYSIIIIIILIMGLLTSLTLAPALILEHIYMSLHMTNPDFRIFLLYSLTLPCAGWLFILNQYISFSNGMEQNWHTTTTIWRETSLSYYGL